MKTPLINTTKIALLSLFSMLVVGATASCTEAATEYEWPDEWVDNSDGTDEPDKPKPDEGDGTDPEKPKPDDPDNPNPDESDYTAPRFIWIDAAANFKDYADNKENIVIDVQKAYNAGFTDLVVDIRPDNGDILYESSHGDQVDWLGGWINGQYQKVYWSGSYDYLQTFIDAADSFGLRVHAGFNTFVGGKESPYGLGACGPLFNNLNNDYAAWLNLEGGIVSIMDSTSDAYDNFGTKFLNPIHEGTQEYLINLLTDLATNYPGLEGIILDRGRFDGVTSDFSDYTRAKFEEYIGETLENWPGDVLPAGYSSAATLPSPAPKYMGKWFTFRAKAIHDFMEKASTAIREAAPGIKVGAYVGGWYSTYFDVGVNWASPEYSTSKFETRYMSWADEEYDQCGYADNMDIMLIGAYAKPDNLYGMNEWSIQGFCSLADKRIAGACPVVAGGPDLNPWADNGYNVADAEILSTSVQTTIDACGGFFLFDMIHLKNSESAATNLWDYVKIGVDDLDIE